MTGERDPHDETDDTGTDGPGDQTGESRRGLTDDELADEMAEESFPGSDPPSTWAGPDDEGHH